MRGAIGCVCVLALAVSWACSASGPERLPSNILTGDGSSSGGSSSSGGVVTSSSGSGGSSSGVSSSGGSIKCNDPEKGDPHEAPYCEWTRMMNGQTVTVTGVPMNGSPDGGPQVSFVLTAIAPSEAFASIEACEAQPFGWTISAPGLVPGSYPTVVGSALAIGTGGKWAEADNGSYGGVVVAINSGPPIEADGGDDSGVGAGGDGGLMTPGTGTFCSDLFGPPPVAAAPNASIALVMNAFVGMQIDDVMYAVSLAEYNAYYVEIGK